MPYSTPRPDASFGGRHELGQNFLVDRDTVAAVVRLTADTTGPIVEIGPGDGALTIPLAATGRRVTAVELDPRRARGLVRRLPGTVDVVNADVLAFRFPTRPHTVVGNIPFHLTTPILRRLLTLPDWDACVLLVQWEVARRRAGVGGASLLTASWWPWYEFRLHGRVPAHAFRPRPSVDGGLLAIRRRPAPLVADRAGYQAFTRRVFTARGRGLRQILRGILPERRVDAWLRTHEVPPHALPKDLDAAQWAALWSVADSPATVAGTALREDGRRRSTRRGDTTRRTRRA
ncbi:hypothetical protein GCM10023205_59000 [Yinghuangia aomiensis]|uniref:Ribosomal RNA adenine methylase transferase N-terminal domain-containing protein n=1 Tax=Yinghuangia aomiensis TaxID=676205 RepID=A0ABP9HXS7_9ACTN